MFFLLRERGIGRGEEGERERGRGGDRERVEGRGERGGGRGERGETLDIVFIFSLLH